MDLWQLIITIAAGIITISTLFEKIGNGIAKAKKTDDYVDKIKELPGQMEELKTMYGDRLKALPDQMEELKTAIAKSNSTNDVMAQALLGIIRNELYICFKEHREIGACTDDEFRVQTALHDAYKRLGGNGEEAVWWEKKRNWKIVSEDEFERLYIKHLEDLQNC